jgi:hypothetical protein
MSCETVEEAVAVAVRVGVAGVGRLKVRALPWACISRDSVHRVATGHGRCQPGVQG